MTSVAQLSYIILASGSAIRRQILTNAGISFRVAKPDVDEDALKKSAAAGGKSLPETAMLLAEAKALAISDSANAYVVGADQILEFEGRGFDKPTSISEATERLNALSGKTHTLINAVCVARSGRVIFRHSEQPVLHMRALSVAEIAGYLAAAGEDILSSVGAYQVERLGARLFNKIEGDYFAVLGLSLYPLLGFLRSEGALEF